MLKTRLSAILASLVFLGSMDLFSQDHPTLVIDTSLGRIVIEVYPDKAPKTVENFLAYVKAGHYDRTVFHRVFPMSLIQGGGFDANMKERPNRPPIENEADNGLTNERGTISMARAADPNSARSQFFINVGNNSGLDHQSKTPEGWGYTVFGRVTSGIDVAEAISYAPTGTKGLHQNVPILPVTINRLWIQ